MLDNKVGVQNRKMADFINVGEFFIGQEKQKDGGCVQTLGQEKKQGGQGSESWRYFKGYLRQLRYD